MLNNLLKLTFAKLMHPVVAVFSIKLLEWMNRGISIEFFDATHEGL